MPDSFNSSASEGGVPVPLFLDPKSAKKCHVYLPGNPEPTSAIIYNNRFYGYVKFFPDLEAARRATERLQARGNEVVLTRVAKGVVLWVLEPEARLVLKNKK
jgi:ATP-dependent exoDNAse (exonuclease V) alpha subunit